MIDLGYARVRASRITYVGELGWELYIPTEFAAGVFDAIVAAGDSVGLVLAGYHAMNSLRMEKGYRHWGHDITDDDTPLEAGLGFAVAWDKRGGFIGRDALLRQREARRDAAPVQFALSDPSQLLYHNEPIWRDGELVGRTTSGMFGHTIGKPLALGYVPVADGGHYEIEVAGERITAEATLKPFHDPASARIRS